MKKLLLLLLIVLLSPNIYAKATVEGTITYLNTGKCYEIQMTWYRDVEVSKK